MIDEVYRLREGAVAWQEIDGETILLDLEASTYLGANPAGSVLWAGLAAGSTRRDLVQQLLDRFDVGAEQAGRDVDAFLRSCAERGYLSS